MGTVLNRNELFCALKRLALHSKHNHFKQVSFHLTITISHQSLSILICLVMNNSFHIWHHVKTCCYIKLQFFSFSWIDCQTHIYWIVNNKLSQIPYPECQHGKMLAWHLIMLWIPCVRNTDEKFSEFSRSRQVFLYTQMFSVTKQSGQGPWV